MFKRCLPVTNVLAAGVATLDFSNLFGYAVERVILQLGGTAMTKAMITALQVRANTKLIQDTTGARMDARMAYRGITANAAFLTIDFTEIRSKTIIGQKLGAIDTRLCERLTGELTIAGATAPTMVAWAEVSSLIEFDKLYGPAERALTGKVLSQTYNFAAAGEFPVMLPYGRQGGSLIKRIFFHGATVTEVEIKKNGITYHETVDAVNDFVQVEHLRAPQANIYAVDFIVDGNQSNVLNAADAQTMEYYVTVSGAGNVTVEVEMLDPLSNN